MATATPLPKALYAHPKQCGRFEMTQHTGGCACGAVRYELNGTPKFCYLCQCRDCQRATGSGHAALMMFEKTACTISGELSYYEVVADSSSTISRGFCPRCGNPIVAQLSAYPELLIVSAASLDDPNLFNPTRVLWHTSAQPWDTINESLKIHGEGI